MPNPTHFQKMRRPSPLLSTLSIIALAVAAPLGSGLAAQEVRILTRPDAERIVIRSSDSQMIGVTTAGESERADTLGLRIESVATGSPAEKAGLKKGDRLQSVNGMNLRADRSDAGEEDYAGVLNRRLQREVQRTKAGESIELRVLSDGATKTVRVTPVKGSEFLKAEEGGMLWRTESRDRAVLGITIASTGTSRDTLGVFVQAVTKDGPAEKAGIFEGDRIAAINGVSLRVARDDSADAGIGAAKAERLSREVEKLKAGDAAELTVVTAGRSRTVRVTSVKASDLPGGDANSFSFRRPEGAGALELPFGGAMPLRLHELEGQRLQIERPSVIRRIRTII